MPLISSTLSHYKQVTSNPYIKIFSHMVFFFDKVSHGLGWPQTHNVAEHDLELLILLSLHHKHWN